MKVKTALTALLSLFIIGSVIYLIAGEISSHNSPVSQKADQLKANSTSNEPEEADAPAAAAKEVPFSAEGSSEAFSPEPSQKVVVYYFRSTVRCPACRSFETFTSEVIHNVFAEELSNGRLKWTVINVDEPGNGHFVKDYQLYTKSIVVAKVKDNSQFEWKNLKRIWQLVSNKEAFMSYVQDEIRDYLGNGR